jgi:non-ribosomal peptide synthetase component E (peptide arylation enzyme)
MLQVDSAADLSTLGDIPRHHARSRPHRVAIHYEGQHLSYGELDRRTNPARFSSASCASHSGSAWSARFIRVGEHDLLGKPASTFPDHALGRGLIQVHSVTTATRASAAR